MTTFLDIALSFPTALFSGALLLATLYWLLVMVGMLDLDFLELDGLAEGLEGIDGAVDGALDGAVDGALDGVAEGAVDGALDGVAEGATEGLAEGAAEGAHDAVDTAVQASFLGSILAALNLRQVPVTVTFSGLAVTGWLFSYLLMRYLAPSLAGLLPPLAVGLGAGLLAFAVSLPVTSTLVRPLAPLFKTDEGRRRSDIIGHSVVVSTGRVDSRFGQAELDDGEAGMVLQVRCDHDNRMRRGDHALVVSYDPVREAFVIEPMDAARATQATRSAATESSPLRPLGVPQGQPDPA